MLIRYRFAAFLTALLLAPSAYSAAVESDPEPLRSAMCFAPGTPPEVVERYARRNSVRLPQSLLPAPLTKFTFDDDDRWSSTATDGGGLGQGEPMTLTWSIVPDGTSIFGYNGEPTAPSDLRARLDEIYGNEAVWLPLFQQVFDRWSELTGIQYVHEPNDDGSAWTQFSIAGGVLGVRGDVRISGHPFTGIPGGVLAYNFFPNTGDMVIDTDDSFFDDTSNNSLRLRNTLAHEHGHGIGLAHVCPVNGTLAANRGYGDPDEDNDAPGTPADLGSVASSVTLENRSIDDNSDIDFYSFTVVGERQIDVIVAPVGSTYLSGPQGVSCGSGSNFNSLAVHDLAFRVLDTDASTELVSVDAAGTGAVETLVNFGLQSGAGTYFLEITGDATNAAQLFQLDLTVESSLIFTDNFESGDTSLWTLIP